MRYVEPPLNGGGTIGGKGKIEGINYVQLMVNPQPCPLRICVGYVYIIVHWKNNNTTLIWSNSVHVSQEFYFGLISISHML